jgi:hypothetical protein
VYKDHVTFDHDTYPFEEVLKCYGNATLALLMEMKNKYPEQEEGFFQMANNMFSEILLRFNPEYEKYPDFTVEAMDYAMQLLANKKLSEMPTERRAEIEEHMKHMLEEQQAKIEEVHNDPNLDRQFFLPNDVAVLEDDESELEPESREVPMMEDVE